MASKAVSSQQSFAPVLAALATMQSSGNRTDKTSAHEYLESFQKSTEAWTTTHAILQSADTTVEAKLFAATTLKGKITYDLHQLPPEATLALRDSILSLLLTYKSGPRPIRTQLCVCLASLAVQMPAWKDVVGTIVSTLGKDTGDCVLEFLRILPEEVREGRKINLTEEELDARTAELLEDNAGQVLQLLIAYSETSPSAASNPHLYECIASWAREIPALALVSSPLMDKIIQALQIEESFDAAVECVSALYRETRDVDECQDAIERIYPRLIALRPKIQVAAANEDGEQLRGLTRLFAEAGEAWVIMIARNPTQFRGLVEAVLECCARDGQQDAVSVTFLFWYELKQYVTIERYVEARAVMANIFDQLVDVMIKHLEFPDSDAPEGADLFDGDREQEDKFREARHGIGDVLKDCCSVIGEREALGKVYKRIQQWLAEHSSKASEKGVPHWQQLEAPMFAMRAMGKMVSLEESTVLPQVIPLIVSIPDHEKLKFQAIMIIGRYTEWTAEHPETIGAQLNYVISGFHHQSPEVVQAAAMAIKFMGADCANLLAGQISQLHGFYEAVFDSLSLSNQKEVTEGVAAVVGSQPVEKVYATMKLFCDPLLQRLIATANNAKDDQGHKAVADLIEHITTFIQAVRPSVPPTEANPAVKYCEELLPVLSALASNFVEATPIQERVCRCWRHMVLSYRSAMVPLLPTLAQDLSNGFQASHEGCYLWATDAIVREFSEGAEHVDKTTSNAVYQFFEQQAVAFLRTLNNIPPEGLPDVIEDFFRLLDDVLTFFSEKSILSPIAEPILSAAVSGLTLQAMDPLISVLNYVRRLLGFGTPNRPYSSFSSPDDDSLSNPPEIQAAVKRLALSQGETLVQRVLTGMMFTFPGDCYPDASGALITLFKVLPQETATWVQGTVLLLPAGTVKPGEADRLMKGISQNLADVEKRKIRTILQDFTNSYRRRNVAPREGLGRLEAAKFRFNG